MLKKTGKKKAGLLKTVLALFLLGAISLCAFADWFAAFLLFHPWKPNADWKPTTPHCEAVHFPTADGSRLDAIYFPCENAKAIVLYSHGNGETLKSLEPLGEFYRKRYQISILMYDYRGYGRSEGKPTASGILEDGRAARKWLAEREEINPSEIVQMGFSLGGTVAIDMASLDGARGLILQSTFSSLPDMGSVKLPFLPVRQLLHEPLDAAAKIQQYHGPLLLSHGTFDGTIPYWQGQKLYFATGGPKTLFTVENGGHVPPQGAEYDEHFVRFLEEL